jgi:hypothetical protein
MKANPSVTKLRLTWAPNSASRKHTRAAIANMITVYPDETGAKRSLGGNRTHSLGLKDPEPNQ